MRKLLTFFCLLSFVFSSGTKIVNIVYKEQPGTETKLENNSKKFLSTKTKKQVSAQNTYKKQSSISINYNYVIANYQQIIAKNTSIKGEISLSSDLGYMPFGGENKIKIGYFVSTVCLNEQVLNFILQNIINYHHHEPETIIETIVAVLFAVGIKLPAAILGSISLILYCYFEVFEAVDEGQGVAFNLLLFVVLIGAWAQ